jgi:hypothetical protein
VDATGLVSCYKMSLEEQSGMPRNLQPQVAEQFDVVTTIRQVGREPDGRLLA